MAKSVKKPLISGFAVLAGLFKRACVRRRKVSGHLGIIVEAFVLHLYTGGYTPGVIRDHLEALEHFSRWLNQQRVPLEHLSTLHVQRFLKHHLPRCQCPKPAPKGVRHCRAALGRLVVFLRGQGRIQECQAPMRPATSTEELLAAYDRHLDQVCGLSAETRRRRQRTAQRFLRWRFGSRRPEWRQLRARETTRFVVEEARGLGSGGIHSLVACLRSFLGFLEFSGRLPQGLAQSVPRPRRLAAPVPSTVLERTQWRSFLQSFDRATGKGQRDYAVALCLGALGLRTPEVAALTLGDLDWRAMTIRLRQTKQRRQRLLPLPDALAKAILTYLKKGRPRTQSRMLFVRQKAPMGGALTVKYIRQLVTSALARCGIKSAGPRVLRHTWATWAHRQGAGLKLIADVLGHRSWQTTQRYAHVQLEELRAAALPWPRIKE